jgi:hypothetical protein
MHSLKANNTRIRQGLGMHCGNWGLCCVPAMMWWPQLGRCSGTAVAHFDFLSTKGATWGCHAVAAQMGSGDDTPSRTGGCTRATWLASQERHEWLVYGAVPDTQCMAKNRNTGCTHTHTVSTRWTPRLAGPC